MDEKKVARLFAALEAVVNDGEPWKEKRSAIQQYAIDNEQDGNLEEFLAWFYTEEEDDRGNDERRT